MLGNAPAWSPGGKRIAFAARAAAGSADIYLVNPDGSHLTRLTRPPI
jgi:Tol biopolymer transport system component